MAPKPKAYLLIAHYNHDKWKALRDKEPERAEEIAEALFPDGEEKEKPKQPLPYPEEVLMVRSFHSSIFADLPSGFEEMPRKDKNDVLDGLIEGGKTDIGWIAVVDEDHFLSFMGRMGGGTSPLWRMYDIDLHTLDPGWDPEEICGRFKLNDDRMTDDIYIYMSPVHWGHRKT
jgi:hypothetical protein